MSYEVDGEQYIAVAMGTALWTFKLGGTLKPQPAPRSGRGAPQRRRDRARSRPRTLVQSADRGVGRRYAVDEHAFNPMRARVKARHVCHLHRTTAQMTHTVAAEDGSWTTGAAEDARSPRM